jgi:hypothetical protein
MVKMSLFVVAFLSLALTGCGLPISHIDWIDFVQFNGIKYIAANYFAGADGRELVDADLGSEFARVKYKYPGTVLFNPPECCRDGDAAYLDKGTAVYIVKGYNPEFRLAAFRDDRLVLYEADTNPKAQTGADLLDIGGKVHYIGVNSAEDGVTELAAIEAPEQMAVLVELVLGAPVDQTHLTQVGIKYFIAFHLRDGTVVTRGYSPNSGELSRGIMLPEAFRIAIEQALLATTPAHP